MAKEGKASSKRGERGPLNDAQAMRAPAKEAVLDEHQADRTITVGESFLTAGNGMHVNARRALLRAILNAALTAGGERVTRAASCVLAAILDKDADQRFMNAYKATLGGLFKGHD